MIDNPDAFYLKAFGELTTERPGSFSGFMPIPHSSIIDYAHRAGLDRAMTDGFVLIIRKMDAAYTKWHDEIADKQTRQTQGGLGNRTKAK